MTIAMKKDNPLQPINHLFVYKWVQRGARLVRLFCAPPLWR